MPKNCSKTPKIAPRYVKILKNFTGEHFPGPPRAFFILNMLQKIFARKNTFEI